MLNKCICICLIILKTVTCNFYNSCQQYIPTCIDSSYTFFHIHLVCHFLSNIYLGHLYLALCALVVRYFRYSLHVCVVYKLRTTFVTFYSKQSCRLHLYNSVTIKLLEYFRKAYVKYYSMYCNHVRTCCFDIITCSYDVTTCSYDVT